MRRCLGLVAAVVGGLVMGNDAGARVVGFYQFEGNANDAGPLGLHGTTIGATAAGAGYEGGAFQFNGAGDWVQLPLNINPGAMPKLTMGAWVNADVVSAVRQIISHDDGGYDRSIGEDTRGGGGLTWSAFMGSGVLAGPAPATTGEWVFVAAVFDQAAGTTRLHVNGASTSVSNFGTGLGLTYTAVGRNPSFGEFFSGRIDNVFFYDEALSTAQVEAIRVGGSAAILPRPGDANWDGRVDADDYALVDRGHARGLSGWSNGDFNADGVVDGADYVIIDGAFGEGNPAPVGMVPEPGCGVLLVGCVALLGRRRRSASGVE